MDRGGPRSCSAEGRRKFQRTTSFNRTRWWTHYHMVLYLIKRALMDCEKIFSTFTSHFLPSGKFSTDASQYWDQFYEVHQDKFFKDRKWLFLEFPELLPASTIETRTSARHSHQVAAEAASGSSQTGWEMGNFQHNGSIQQR